MTKFEVLPIVLTMLITAVISTPVNEGKCSCGVFPENSQSAPIIVQSLEFAVSCDEEGAQTCGSLCIAVAEGARDQAPALICEKLDGHVENLKVAVFTKTSCNAEDEWNFTGLKSPEPICCDAGKDIVCNS